MEVPFGCKFKFEPDDDQLLAFLACKSNGMPLPSEGFIQEVDLYRTNDPGVLFERSSDKKLVYVFTKLKKVGKNGGKKVERTVTGNRTWKGVDGGKPIYDVQGCLLGEKKNFVLVNKMKMKLGYNMTEFSLHNEALANSRFKDYVVCKIKKKAKKLGGRVRYGGDIQEVEDTSGPSSVSTPSTPVSKEGRQYQYKNDNSVAPLIQNQYQGEQQAQEFYQYQDNSVAPLSQYQYQYQDQGEQQAQEFQQFQDNSVALSQYQYQGEQVLELQQFPESGEPMPMVSEGFDGGDQQGLMSNSRFFQPEEYSVDELVNSWMVDTTFDPFAPNQDQQQQPEESNQLQVLEMIKELVSVP